jgi:hypothetical protein
MCRNDAYGYECNALNATKTRALHNDCNIRKK